MLTDNPIFFASLYVDPIAAGAAPADLQLGTAHPDRMADGLLFGGRNRDSADAFPMVESISIPPPRAGMGFPQVESISIPPPRA